MQFIYPSLLWAFLFLAIPVIIHLFYFRRFKKVYFTNVKFLREVKEETSSRSKLKNILVLILRLLAFSFLILAFAQPFIPKSEMQSGGIHELSVFIDNSFSMNALSQDVALIDKAKDKAREILEGFSDEDRFQIITQDLEAKHQRLVGKEDALEFINQIQPTASVSELSKIIQFQRETLGPEEGNKHIFLISDFQKNITDFTANNLDTSILFNLLALQSVKENNISIDSVWFDAPVPILNESNGMKVKLSNYSENESENIQLILAYNGQNRPLGILDIPPGSSIVHSFQININKTGWHQAELRIIDYPVQFDDSYFFSFLVKPQINVLSINETSPNQFLNAAIQGISHFKMFNQAVNQISYGSFATHDLIILNDLKEISSGLGSALLQFVENGGNVVIFPGRNLIENSYNTFFQSGRMNTIIEKYEDKREVGTVNRDEFIFSNVFEENSANTRLPIANISYRFTTFQNRSKEDILSYRDGGSYLSKYIKGSGHFYVCSAPLSNNDNNLVRNAEIFLPMIYKMAISSASATRIAYTIGRDPFITTDNSHNGSEPIYKIVSDEEFIPAQTIAGSRVILDVKDQIKQSGSYDLVLGDSFLSKLSYNYNRKESDLDYFSISELNDLYGTRANVLSESTANSLSEYIRTNNTGIQLWKWCIAFVLVFLALESILLRFWKT